MKKRFTIIYFLFFPLFFLSSSFCLAMPALAPRQMVKDFLVSASCGDSSKAMTYLSQKADKYFGFNDAVDALMEESLDVMKRQVVSFPLNLR